MTKILVIEDDPGMNFMEKGLKKNPEFEVFTAKTVEEAEKIFIKIRI